MRAVAGALSAAGRLLAALFFWHAATAAAFDLSFTLDDIRHPAFAAERISLQQTAGGTRLTIGTLRAAGRQFSELRLSCREFRWGDGEVRCRGGSAALGVGGTAKLDFRYFPARKALELNLHEVPLPLLATLLPDLAHWQPKGSGDLALHLAGSHAGFSLSVRSLAFADAAATQAGEGIELRLAGTAQQAADAWQWRIEAAWQTGEVYWQPWYLKGAGQTLVATGTLDAAQLRVESARLDLPGIGALDGALVWDRAAGRFAAASLASDDWQAAPAWAAFGQPLLGETPRVEPAGTLRFALAADESGLTRLDLDADLKRLDLGAGRLVLADLHAAVPWRRDAATTARIAAGGGRLGDIPLGAFAVPLAMEGMRFGFARAELLVLDGPVVVEDFAARREASGWHWQLAGAVTPLSMPLLTGALTLPRMEGLLSATIPRIRFDAGTLALDGDLIVAVFDGYLAISGLRVADPFGHGGRLPRVTADVDARHLDLAMLTETFSFGSITGYVDAELRGLEMVGWQPQAFAARIETSPGDFKKRISQRAVQDISSLGGAGAGAAIQRSFLRFFDTFGYERIGLSCRLVGGICEMGGLEEAGHGYLMVKGGGLPALNVIGYNRRVGWDELVSRLAAIAAGNSRPVIE